MLAALPVIDLDLFLADPSSPAAQLEADKCANGLIRFGAILVKESRASEKVNSRFLDTMEDYFAQPNERIMQDLRPEVHFQVGSTLEHTEKPRCHSDENCQKVIAALDPAERPLDLAGGHADPKARFFRRLGEPPRRTAYPTLAMPNVVPAAFADTWDEVMDSCGGQLQAAARGVVQMLENGLGVAPGVLQTAGEYGPHFAGTDGDQLGQLREGWGNRFHTDIGCFSIHGRSRYPGLHIWARNSGKRLAVSLPPGHLLVQAGKQLEHLTSGMILAGYHEVVATEATLAAITVRRADPATATRPRIRISSTSFWQLEADYELDPTRFVTAMKPPSAAVRAERDLVFASGGKQYAVMKVGDHLQNELKHVALIA